MWVMWTLAQNLTKIVNCRAHSRSYINGVGPKFGRELIEDVMKLLYKFENKIVNTQEVI